jgi:hypothetical protein
MSANSKPRFRPTLECLESRELLSGNPFTVPVLPSVPAQVRQFTNQIQGNFNADITQAARATLQSVIEGRLPMTLGNYPGIGQVKLTSVTLDRLTLNQDGKTNGQLTVTFKVGQMSATFIATIANNQLSFSPANALVR